jgi:hypothetical protein
MTLLSLTHCVKVCTRSRLFCISIVCLVNGRLIRGTCSLVPSSIAGSMEAYSCSCRTAFQCAWKASKSPLIVRFQGHLWPMCQVAGRWCCHMQSQNFLILNKFTENSFLFYLLSCEIRLSSYDDYPIRGERFWPTRRLSTIQGKLIEAWVASFPQVITGILFQSFCFYHFPSAFSEVAQLLNVFGCWS